MKLQNNGKKQSNKKCSEFKRHISKHAGLMVIALLYNSPAFAQSLPEDASHCANCGETTQATRNTERQKNQTVNHEIKAATESILRLMMDMPRKTTPTVCVKVPSCNYALILKELQNRNARFLFSGVRAPASARIVFQLESEQAGLRQTVYFL